MYKLRLKNWLANFLEIDFLFYRYVKTRRIKFNGAQIAENSTDLCAKHGGGKRCPEPECTKASQHPSDRCIKQDCKNNVRQPRSRCVKHGGAPRKSKRCMAPDCTKRATTRNLCTKHGGGKRCQESECKKAKCAKHNRTTSSNAQQAPPDQVFATNPNIPG